MNTNRICAGLLALGVWTGQAQGDVVADWNVITVNANATSGADLMMQARAIAAVHAAIYDAVNAIDRRYSVYAVDIKAPAGASLEAAAAAAAHGVLSKLHAKQQANFDAALAVSLAKLPDDQAARDGVALGKAVAEKILALRESDRFSTPIAHTPATGPGKWQPTPPGVLPAVGPSWGSVAPFMKSAEQFDAPEPPKLDSTEYAKQVNEVKRIGGKTSVERSADQTEAAVFWTALAAPLWNQAARQAAVQKRSSVVENARLFALLNMAGTDSFIPCWHLKFKHNFWRPIHAIRHAESADNRAVSADPAWESLIVTPPFPEYVSGHTAWAGTSEKILQTFFGSDEINLTVTNPAVGITRPYASFSQMAQEVNDARVWGGVHYRISDERGLELGRRVAEYCLKNFLLPISRVLQN